MRTYSKLIDARLLDYPAMKKRCFYCGKPSMYVLEVVVDHLCSLDMRSKIPIAKTMELVREVVENQGAEAITKARHLVSACSDCHVKLVRIGWTL